ncbi:hypothetical protein [Streptomyces sp. CC210A]|uniref:hypothetical protein n=1 Tax=Streptomyces sp. CC210A TaxID=2898184 RepID=UPI001F206EE9|nr:hypothetical protein [Streptomyces sp. CC210A]
MTSTTFAAGAGTASGATALRRPHDRPALRPGDVLRAVRVAAATAFEVAVLGRYGEEDAAGLVRRRR